MAIQIIAGDPLRTHITYLDEGNTLITGATFDVVTAHKPDGSVFDVTVTEEAPGVYVVTGQTRPDDPPGMWYLLLRGSADDAYFSESWDVRNIVPPLVVTQEHPTHGASRQELRRMIATMLGDLTLVRATDGGTESSVIDEVNLAREMNAFNGMQLVCIAGPTANIGKIGTVSSNSPGDRSINFFPPLPLPTMQTDVFEMVNHRGVGWTFDMYNRAINDAILRAGENHGSLPYTLTLDETFHREHPFIVIPQPFLYFSGLDVVDRRGNRKPVPPSMYRIDASLREIELRGKYRELAHGKQLRLKGHRRPETLESDDARTHILSEWIVHEAMAILLEQDTSTGATQGARDRLFYLERQGADGRRPSVVTTYPPNTVRLA